MNSLGAWPARCSRSQPRTSLDLRGPSRVVAPRRPQEGRGLPQHLAEFGKRPGGGHIQNWEPHSGHTWLRLSYRNTLAVHAFPSSPSTAWELGRLLTPVLLSAG
ncbi:unnamed protein product [Pipistrellus nathusii]|uniref:Uncharacterized protein n=1 Tax=Pipistrellus nathusii TaxID=59473 RepID=A0ABP0A0G0_PIPNA